MIPEAKAQALFELDPDCSLPPRLLALFLRSAPEQLQSIADACAARDVAAARDAAHKVKGGLYAAGASRLANLVEELRTTIATADWNAVETQLRRITDDFGRLLGELRRQLEATKA